MKINRRQLRRLIESTILESEAKEAQSGGKRIPKPGEGSVSIKSGAKLYMPLFGGKSLKIKSRGEKPASIKIFAANEDGTKGNLMEELSDEAFYTLAIKSIVSSTKNGVFYIEFSGTRGLSLSTSK